MKSAFRISKSFCTVIVLAVTLIVACTLCYANSAEPPALIVLLKNNSENTNVSINIGDERRDVQKRVIAWETYYVFYSTDIYSRDLSTFNNIMLDVSTDDTNFSIVIDDLLLTRYNNVVTLDVKNQTVSVGKLLSRSILLVFLRLFLTMVIEGGIFFAFGFRQKKSWLAFLVINLITQGWLNIWINSITPVTSYIIFSLIIAEFFIFLFEMITFCIFVKEQGKIKRIGYVLVANILSLILGGYMITLLPI